MHAHEELDSGNLFEMEEGLQKKTGEVRCNEKSNIFDSFSSSYNHHHVEGDFASKDLFVEKVEYIANNYRPFLALLEFFDLV